MCATTLSKNQTSELLSCYQKVRFVVILCMVGEIAIIGKITGVFQNIEKGFQWKIFEESANDTHCSVEEGQPVEANKSNCLQDY